MAEDRQAMTASAPVTAEAPRVDTDGGSPDHRHRACAPFQSAPRTPQGKERLVFDEGVGQVRVDYTHKLSQSGYQYPVMSVSNMRRPPPIQR